MLDTATLVTAALVIALPFIFMGYVRFLTRRALNAQTGHTSKDANNAAYPATPPSARLHDQ